MKEIRNVRKRDGRIVPFDKEKITEAIFKAARSVGGENRYLSEDLAEAVTLYLERQFQDKIPSVEEIQDIVERVLIKTGHAKTAKAYILYRQKRAKVRKIKEGIKPDDLIEREKITNIRDIKISVVRSDENLTDWDREKIISALLKETGLSRNIAEIIVNEVEEEVITSKLNILTSAIIRELVNAKLIQYGFEKEREKHSRLGIPTYDVEQIFKNFKGTPDQLSLKFGKYIKKEYAISNVFSDEVILSHFKKEIFIHCLEEIDKFYSLEIDSQLNEEETNIINEYFSFVLVSQELFKKENVKNKKIFLDLLLPDEYEKLYEIVQERDINLELKGGKESSLIVQKIDINTDMVFDKSKNFDLVKKAFIEKEKFLESILKQDINEFTRKFNKKFEIEINGEIENLDRIFDGNTKINFKMLPEKFSRYIGYLKNENVCISGKITKENVNYLKNIRENLIARIYYD